jgi:hypothetical protein
MRVNSLDCSAPMLKSCEALCASKTSIMLRRNRLEVRFRTFLLLLSMQTLAGCHYRQPSVTLTTIPIAGPGGPDNVAVFEGDVRQARDGQRLVLYSKAGVWWLQPNADGPYTAVQPGGHWKREVHLGSEYAAILVDARYNPPATTPTLPPIGNSIIAISTAPGSAEGPFHSTQPSHTIRFSGNDWSERVLPSDRLGPHTYSPNNISLDEHGFLHLRITKHSEGWVCSELTLNRSLGYGTYTFTVKDSAQLEPAAVFSMFTWSDSGREYNNREMNINLSRWGHSEGNNAEFIVQPFFVKTNSYRFTVPSGPHTYSMRWEPGSAIFRSASGGTEAQHEHPIALHTFSGNVPPAGDERINMNFCDFGLAEHSLRQEAEIVVEHFQYLP